MEISCKLRHNAAMPDANPADESDSLPIPLAELVDEVSQPSPLPATLEAPPSPCFEDFVATWVAESAAPSNPSLPPIRTRIPLTGKTLSDKFDGFFDGRIQTFLATSILDNGEPVKTYVVPPRFGIGAILGLTTSLAILFAIFRACEVHPFLYLYFGLLSFVICIVQMRFGNVPRVASTAAGAILSLTFGIVLIATDELFFREPCAALGLVIFLIPVGAFFGYVTGTMMAGIFLAMDLFEQRFGKKQVSEKAANPLDVPDPPDPSESLDP